jgi:hypothetical protein
MKYILTLDFIKSHCYEVAGNWDGNEYGPEEDKASAATEILELVEKIEKLLALVLLELVQ